MTPPPSDAELDAAEVTRAPRGFSFEPDPNAAFTALELAQRSVIALSDAELDAKVAEVDGWKWRSAKEEPDNPFTWLVPPSSNGLEYGARKRNGVFDYFGSLLPSYSTDLNAIDRAVLAWATMPERRNAFVVELVKVVHGDLGEFGATFALVNATARQRSEALTSAAAKEGSDG